MRTSEKPNADKSRQSRFFSEENHKPGERECVLWLITQDKPDEQVAWYKSKLTEDEYETTLRVRDGMQPIKRMVAARCLSNELWFQEGYENNPEIIAWLQKLWNEDFHSFVNRKTA